MTGIDLIRVERERQVGELGYDLSHDLGHGAEALAFFAAGYAMSPRDRAALITLNPDGFVFRGNTSRIRELQKAGALIAAAIDVLIAEGK